MQTKKVIFLMGPTASGKTALALKLAEKIPCEIISVDSALVYKQMTIGTAKPSADQLLRVRHHLIDIRDPLDPYSAADFREDALRVIKEIFARGKTPLLVGGTMLYFHALLNGLSTMPSANAEIRADILQRAQNIGWDGLHQLLSEVDPDIAKRINPNDQQRIQRALEIYEITNELPSKLQTQPSESFPYPLIQFAIVPQDRAVLHQHIEQRFDQMLDQGLVAEVEKLYQRGDLNSDLPAIRAVGYRQVWQYLNGQYDYHAMRFKGIVATRQLAKRQLTWLRSWPDLNILTGEPAEMLKTILTKI